MDNISREMKGSFLDASIYVEYNLFSTKSVF